VNHSLEKRNNNIRKYILHRRQRSVKHPRRCFSQDQKGALRQSFPNDD
jgi:hypothetical protein